jgi:adenylate cyclase
LVQNKKTSWLMPEPSRGSPSLVNVKAVVAAPILDRAGQVIGALYGERRQPSAAAGLVVTRLEAMLVEVLAKGLAAGLARLDQEQAAVRAHVQLEEFFTPELYRQLEGHPELLRPQEADITVLFCDVRGFSRISERLGPARTVEWISDVMGVLSDCVLAQQGVVVEYVGDEVMAMWGAPLAVPDHAARACRAALDMLACLPQLNERWQAVLQEPMSVGIGINSGPAQVGNVGSRRKFKYGALGNTVNLASRVQGATKYLKKAILLARGTRDRLDEGLAVRRLCRVQVVNIGEPVDLFELAGGCGSEWQELRSEYEKALECFEKGSFRTAIRLLGIVLNEHPEDTPALLLLSRAVGCLTEVAPNFSPVWELPGK